MWLHQLQSAARPATPSPAQSGIGYPRAQIWSRGALDALELPLPGTQLKVPFCQVPSYFCYLQSALFACAGLRPLMRQLRRAMLWLTDRGQALSIFVECLAISWR